MYHTTADGVCVDWQIAQLIDSGVVHASKPIEPQQVQPNSLDLRVGRVAFRVGASFLPINSTVEDRIRARAYYEIDLSDGAILEQNVIYVVRLQEELQLPGDLSGKVNPKSSTGRLDIFCRAVTDRGDAFDEVRAGYRGPVYLEVVPRSFAVRLTEGDCLSQLRFSRGNTRISDWDLKPLVGSEISLFDSDFVPLEPRINDGLLFTVNLQRGKDRTVGYAALETREAVTIRSRGHARRRYWEWIRDPGTSDIILKPNNFYIFASYERLALGPRVCAEMVPYDAGMGEVRSHYAGFFDSGFGYGSEKTASRVVLEVRNHHVPYALAHRQTLFRVYALRNQADPKQLYGSAERTSSYQAQGLLLAKQFQQPRESADPQDTEALSEHRVEGSPDVPPNQLPLFKPEPKPIHAEERHLRLLRLNK